MISRIRSVLLIFAALGLIFVVGWGIIFIWPYVNSFFRSILTSTSTIFYLILLFGLSGVIKGVVDLFNLGAKFSPSRNLYEPIYLRKVKLIADNLIFVVGALLFIWLL